MIGLPTIVSSRMSARLIPARIASPAISPSSALRTARGHLPGTLGMHHRVRDAAHQVLAEADLRVHHAVRGEDRAVGEVGEVAGDRRRADVDRDAVGRVVEARPDRRDLVAVVDRDRDPVLARLERRLERADDLEVGLEAGQLPTRARAPRTAGRGRRSARRARAARPRRSAAGRPGRRRTSRTSRPLRTTCRWTWLSGGTSIRRSPWIVRRAAEPPVGGEPVLGPIGSPRARPTATGARSRR